MMYNRQLAVFSVLLSQCTSAVGRWCGDKNMLDFLAKTRAGCNTCGMLVLGAGGKRFQMAFNLSD